MWTKRAGRRRRVARCPRWVARRDVGYFTSEVAVSRVLAPWLHPTVKGAVVFLVANEATASLPTRGVFKSTHDGGAVVNGLTMPGPSRSRALQGEDSTWRWQPLRGPPRTRSRLYERGTGRPRARRLWGQSLTDNVCSRHDSLYGQLVHVAMHEGFPLPINVARKFS